MCTNVLALSRPVGPAHHSDCSGGRHVLGKYEAQFETTSGGLTSISKTKKNGKYQYINYITKYSSIDQELYLLYNHHLKSDILLEFFEMKSSMIYS